MTSKKSKRGNCQAKLAVQPESGNIANTCHILRLKCTKFYFRRLSVCLFFRLCLKWSSTLRRCRLAVCFRSLLNGSSTNIQQNIKKTKIKKSIWGIFNCLNNTVVFVFQTTHSHLQSVSQWSALLLLLLLWPSAYASPSGRGREYAMICRCNVTALSFVNTNCN